MKAHALNYGETILVTGTQDVEAARAFAIADPLLRDMDYDERLPLMQGRAVAGCIIPGRSHEEFPWWWREGDGGNRVKAVEFS